jgi:N4-gp56 family major capsid protein
MAETILATASERSKWVKAYFSEYVRGSKFRPYMGKGPTNIIVTKYELQEEAGKTINIPLITKLKGKGVSGSQVLDGAEEQLGNYNFPISIEWRRHGVRVPKSTSYKTEINLLDAARDMLREWEAERLRDDVIDAFLSVIPSSSTTTPIRYGVVTESTNGGYEILSGNYIASEANKDAWLVNNRDRVLFGKLRSNYSAGDHSAALATIDSTDDKLTVAVGNLAKRMAKGAAPNVRPYKTKDGNEWFVMFCGSRSFRDLEQDSAMLLANRDARPRSVESNPIFQDGDLLYRGVIYREIEEMPVLAGVGNGGIDVDVNMLCGAQAAAVAWGQMPTPQTDRDKDYKFRPGVAIEELLGVEKIFFRGKQHGCVTVYTAAVPDA